MRVVLPVTGPYTAKDQRKSDLATCFIGRGSPRSSTHKYMLAWGERANKGTYTADDIVFVSVEGARNGRVPLDTDELLKAITAGATIITDPLWHRTRPYNVGEREVEAFLLDHSYDEAAHGVWKPQR